MAQDHKATITAEAKGTDKAAKDLGKITEAEEKLGQKTKQAGSATEEATKQTEKLNAAESDYVGLLTQIHPALGGMVDGILKAGKITGDLASQNIILSGTLKKVREGIKANAGALKLLGAGAAVAAGIYLIVKALEAERKARERVAKAIKAQSDAMNELKGEERDRAAEIERLQRARRADPFSPDQARAAAETATRIGERSPFIDEAAVNQAVAAVGGAENKLGGGRFGIEQIERLALLIEQGRLQIDGDAPAAVIERRVSAALERHAERLDAIFRTETEQRAESIQQAGKEAASVGGTTINLEEFLRSRESTRGMDIERLAKAMQFLLSRDGTDGPSWTKKELVDAGLVDEEGKAREPTEQEWVVLEEAYRALQGAREKAARGSEGKEAEHAAVKEAVKEGMAEAKTEGGGETIVKIENHMQHARIVYPDAAAVRRNTINGESDNERREVG